LPFNFSVLLNFLALKTKQESIRDQIFAEGKVIDRQESLRDLKRFCSLFRNMYRDDAASISDEKIYRNVLIEMEIKKNRNKKLHHLSSIKLENSKRSESVDEYFKTELIKKTMIDHQFKNRRSSHVDVNSIIQMNDIKSKCLLRVSNFDREIFFKRI
jgi:hypothetical protein